jgi:hypothetical protein
MSDLLSPLPLRVGQDPARAPAGQGMGVWWLPHVYDEWIITHALVLVNAPMSTGQFGLAAFQAPCGQGRPSLATKAGRRLSARADTFGRFLPNSAGD